MLIRDEHMKILKYELRLIDEQVVLMPAKAKPLYVGLQNDRLHVWAEVNTNNRVVERLFYVHGTGHALAAARGAYVGSVQPNALVFHVYEGAER